MPRDAFANAVTWNNSVFQIGSVAGPAISGFIVAHISFSCVYIIDAICSFLFFPSRVADSTRAGPGKTRGTKYLAQFAGGNAFCSEQTRHSRNHHASTCSRFCWEARPRLLPMFADQILHVGAIGLGWMRAMPAIGAFGTALLVAYFPPMKCAGREFALVRHRFWNRHRSVRIVARVLVFPRHALFDWRLR